MLSSLLKSRRTIAKPTLSTKNFKPDGRRDGDRPIIGADHDFSSKPARREQEMLYQHLLKLRSIQAASISFKYKVMNTQTMFNDCGRFNS